MPNLDHIGPEIKLVEDFPKKGIIFKDLGPILSNPDYMADILGEMTVLHARLEDATGVEVTAIVALDARGFIFGAQLASQLHLPFVPVRKKGKLPGETIQYKYTKEYGEDAFEIQKETISEGDNVLIIDDILATGGSLLGAAKCVETAGGKVAGMITVTAVQDLIPQAEKTLEGYPVEILL